MHLYNNFLYANIHQNFVVKWNVIWTIYDEKIREEAYNECLNLWIYFSLQNDFFYNEKKNQDLIWSAYLPKYSFVLNSMTLRKFCPMKIKRLSDQK